VVNDSDLYYILLYCQLKQQTKQHHQPSSIGNKRVGV